MISGAELEADCALTQYSAFTTNRCSVYIEELLLGMLSGTTMRKSEWVGRVLVLLVNIGRSRPIPANPTDPSF